MRLYEVAAGILWNGSQVLIARRQAGDHQGGRWEFPGGKKHAGETIEGCLKREMLEEVGIEVAVGSLWRALTHVYPDRRVTLYFYFCDLVGGTPTPLQCDELRWIAPAQLADHTFVDGDLPVLPDLARDLADKVAELGADSPTSPPSR
ncbi:MAG TPA: 8-oxo-dGTP diphosphatase MutT [Candidatus Polarisedimenticolia bacterium]|nr:8-oxo-dGTP diphosphatase MutT [Candidatus Polarisedimenticolia bacterium]